MNKMNSLKNHKINSKFRKKQQKKTTNYNKRDNNYINIMNNMRKKLVFKKIQRKEKNQPRKKSEPVTFFDLF